MDTLWQEIGIDAQHICETTVPGRYQLICDKKFLQSLEQKRKIDKFPTFQPQLDRRAHPTGVLEHPWTRILVQTYKKQAHGKVFPLPAGPQNDNTLGAEDYSTPKNTRTDLSATPLTYSQAVSYVTATNFKNLWEAAYKRHAGAHNKFCPPKSGNGGVGGGMASSTSQPDCSLMPYDAVLKELIQRIFNCPVIHCQADRLHDNTTEARGDSRTNSEECDATTTDPYKANDCHANVLPAIVAIESSTHISVLFYPPAVTTSLYDCITYSPAVLSKSYNKPLFLIYQLLQLSRSLQSMGLFMGDVRLHDIYMRDNLWLQVVPHLESNILQTRQPGNLAVVAPLQQTNVTTTPSEQPPTIVLDPPNDETPVDEYTIDDNGNGNDDDDDDDPDDEAHQERAKFDLKFAYDLQQFTLREYCEMWCNGQMSNFDYLTILNNAAGRTTTNPAYHHVMPWVTDFTARNGANWRDLSKSKYRLNKGDIHLDLMFSHASQQLAALSSCMLAGSPNIPVAGVGGHSGGSSHLPIQNVPHHVSDFLSEITYFVYTARRTPQHILCEHVRKVWVPAEYPVSIQRLQQWTPDECIPEFYTDPMIFKSIHEDLPDLELPAWASCPEDFICKHREALESQYVSERLHHWIDLNFGYKLSGKPAIKSKNVCLSVVDQHKNLCQRGIVQLFTQPHPPKRFPSPWFNKRAPRLSHVYNLTRDLTISPTKPHSPIDIKRLAKSTENLTQSTDSSNPLAQQDTLTTPTHSSGLRSSPRSSTTTLKRSQLAADASNSTTTSTSTTFYPLTNSCIELPKDYNPCQLLQSLETMHAFYARTFPKQSMNGNAQEKIHSGDLLFDGDSDEHSFTNQLFAFDTCNTPTATTPSTTGSSVPKVGKRKNLLAPNVYQMKRRTLKLLLKEFGERELQALGCFIVELFSLHRLRPLLMTGVSAKFAERLQACRTVAEVHRHDLPKCVRYIVRELLMPSEGRKATTELGLPPPTAAQLLEPIFYNLLIPFPNTFYPTYALIRSLHSFDFASTLLELNTHFNCNGQECGRYTDMDRQRVLFERKIAECKVMSCCAHMGHLLEPIGYEQFPPIELLLPHIIDLLSNEQTSILTAWNLFDPVAQALGVAQTQKYLLAPIMKLYDVESFERGMISVRSGSRDANSCGGANGGQVRFSTSSSFKSRKSVKLYHHSFLLRLIVRFGLRCFLHNFIAPLIEAVGGYKEPEDGNGLHYHSVAYENVRRLSKNIVSAAKADDVPSEMTLIEPQMAEAERVSSASSQKQEIEEVFSFDDDVNSDHISNAGTFENKSIDSFDMRATTAEEAQEDFHQVQTTPEKVAISELIYGSKISNTSFDDMDKISAGSRDSPTANAGQLGPKSPTIDIPSVSFRRSYQLNTIDCEIGSRKSVDSFDIITQAAEEEEKQKAEQAKDSTTTVTEEELCDSLKASVISKMSEAKQMQNNRISEMSAESLVWLSHRLGPVLTSRFITRNLLKMLTLCYVGQENLLPEAAGSATDEENNLNYFSVADARVVGDRSASRVLECLMSIAGLFGEEVILLQYFPHISELIALSSKRVTGSLEGAIISSLQLVKYIVPCLKDVTIMEHLKDTFLNAIILPILEVLASTRQLMPSGYLGRSVLARKLLDAIYVLCVRIGPDMSKEHLTVPALRPFFLIFDKAFGISNNFDSMRPVSPPLLADNSPSTPQRERVQEEIRDVFDPALAHISYLAFLRFLGDAIMQRTLVNLQFILTLCHEFEQPAYKSLTNAADPGKCVGSDAVDCPTGGVRDSLATDENQVAANSFGTHVIGNRLEVNNATTPPTSSRPAGSPSLLQPPTNRDDIDHMEVLDMVAYKFDQVPTSRNLKGNWLAYWSHEISRPDKEATLNFKQIKLQSFVGHTNSIRALVALDNENSFISASKDKTVKLWSLRSEGDGRKSTPCQFTYTAHKKSIHSLAFLEAMRIVVSCDSGVHFWDPFIGRTQGVLDAPRHNPVTVVKSLPSPSPLIVAGTSEATVKIIDCRCMQYVNEWRLNSPHQSAHTVRCLTVAPSGNWLAVGLSSGSIVMLDTRTGLLLNTWRPMECDLLQLAAPNDHALVSSALDHSLAVWHANDGILHYQMRPPPEPAHFLQTIDSELVYATSGNRIGVYTDLSSSHAPHTITKLRSENFRGVLTSLAVLPLNRAFLAGNESGNIVMLC